MPFETDRREIVRALDRLTAAVDRKQTIVPVFIVAGSVQMDQVKQMSEYVRAMFEEAGFEVRPRRKEGE